MPPTTDPPTPDTSCSLRCGTLRRVVMQRVVLLTASSLCVPAWASDTAPLEFPASMVLEPGIPPLLRTGSGVFRFFFIRYYACALYVATETMQTSRVLDADSPRRVYISALRNISAFEFIWGLDRGLADNTTTSERAALSTDVDRVRSLIRDIGQIKPGSEVAIDYLPARGVRIVMGGVQRGSWLGGKPLADALLKIWIGERPLDAALKEALLGR